MKQNKPRVLVLDVETAPLLTYCWALFDQTIGLNQIEKDWHLLSWAAKWLDDPPNKVMYMDQSKCKDISDDKKILEGIWKLLDEADVVITQNGKAFDIKKLNARFVLNGMKPTSGFKHIDTKQLAGKHFGFTSKKLEYLTGKLCVKYKKLTGKRKFSGFSLWLGCLANKPAAWIEMKRYNIYDVLSLEELYKKLIPWDSTIDFSLWNDKAEHTCTCGSKDLKLKGYAYTSTGKFQRYVCNSCGKQSRGRQNLFSKDKRDSLKVTVK